MNEQKKRNLNSLLSKDRLPLNLVLQTLKARGIETLMIEGGSKIIQSCVSSGLFDQLIITIAPIFIGADGVPAVTLTHDIQRLKRLNYLTLGNDIVMSATP